LTKQIFLCCDCVLLFSLYRFFPTWNYHINSYHFNNFFFIFICFLWVCITNNIWVCAHISISRVKVKQVSNTCLGTKIWAQDSGAHTQIKKINRKILLPPPKTVHWIIIIIIMIIIRVNVNICLKGTWSSNFYLRMDPLNLFGWKKTKCKDKGK
jgi:hypothetical protein